MAGQGLGATAARGALSTAASQAARVALQVVSVAVLARLLRPSDYGLMAMALAVIGLGHMFRDMGLFAAAIRAPELTAAQRTNLFWVNTALGLGFGLLCVASGPVLSHAYGQPQLTGIALGLAPTFLLAGLATQFRVSLVRDLRFGLLAGIDLGSNVVGAVVAVAAAAAGWDYWALVLQQVAAALAYLAAVGWSAHWLPGRFRRHTGLRPFLRLGGSVMVSGLLTYVGNNVDTVVVGARFSPVATGLYNRGVQLVRTSLKQVEAPIGAVSLPVLARLQHDDTKMLDFARRVQMSLNYPVLLAVAVVAAVPADVVRIGLGDSWEGSSPVVGWIAVGTGLQVLGDVAGMLLVARGLSRPLARLSAVTTLLTVGGVLIGSLGGLTGVAAGYAAAALLVWAASMRTLASSSALPVVPLVWNAARTLALATVASLTARGCATLLPDAPLLGLLVACCVVAATVAVAALLVRAVRRDLEELWSMARSGVRRQRPVPAGGAPED